MRDFEEKFADENGYKPTLSQDKAPIKKYLSELNRIQRQIQGSQCNLMETKQNYY